MARLLIVHHTSSPSMQAMLEAVLAGAGHDDIEGVEVVTRPALTASPVDVLGADGYLLGARLPASGTGRCSLCCTARDSGSARR